MRRSRILVRRERNRPCHRGGRNSGLLPHSRNSRPRTGARGLPSFQMGPLERPRARTVHQQPACRDHGPLHRRMAPSSPRAPRTGPWSADSNRTRPSSASPGTSSTVSATGVHCRDELPQAGDPRRPSGRGGATPSTARSARHRCTARIPAVSGPSTSGTHMSPTNSTRSMRQRATLHQRAVDQRMRLAGTRPRGAHHHVHGPADPRRRDTLLQVPEPVGAHPDQQAPGPQLREHPGHVRVEVEPDRLHRPVEFGDQAFELGLRHTAGPRPAPQPVALPRHVRRLVGRMCGVFLALAGAHRPLVAPEFALCRQARRAKMPRWSGGSGSTIRTSVP